MPGVIEATVRGGFTVGRVTSTTVETENIGEFRHSLSSFASGPSHLVLDLSGVEFMDSTGLGAMLSGLRLATANGGSLRIAGLTESVRRLFDMVKMDRVFDIYASIDEAVAKPATP